jgi:acetylornithine/succinyldiaminopimelate/putrescine aminotransferase
MGSLSVTWDEHYRTPFQPLIHDVAFADDRDPASVTALVDEKTAAIIVEPIQGEGGVRPIAPEVIDAISAAAQRTGALVIADEVQSGSGRTGAFTCSRARGLTPDLMALGKALGAGVPIGAAMVSGKVAAAVAPGDHGTTYGGNLLACRAALVFLDALENGLLGHIQTVSAHLFAGLRALQSRHPGLIAEVRGAGLIAGLDLRVDAQPVIAASLERGLLVNRTASTVVRLLPAYVATKADIDEAIGILDDVLKTVTEEGR